MVLSIHSNLQLANSSKSARNRKNEIAAEKTTTNTMRDEKIITDKTSPDKNIALVEQSIIKPAPVMVQPILQLPSPVSAPSDNQDLDLFSYFLRPINFSKEGITFYFKYTYNHEKYTEYLPYNFSHMIQFLEFGQNNNQSEAYAKSIIKLFLQKIKGCDFINAYSLITSMPKLADVLGIYIEKKEATFLQELQKSLKARFSNIFSNYFSYFQKSPDAFLEALSEQIAKKTNEVQTQQHVDVEHIKKDILRFLETCISKLIWPPKDVYDAWTAVNEIACQAELFLDKKLLSDVDALDDICWSLIHRFCYFMELSADDMAQEDLIKIIHDIHEEKLLLLQIEEQEDLMSNKKEYLLKKIKNYCPYVYTPSTKEYKIYTTKAIFDAPDQTIITH